MAPNSNDVAIPLRNALSDFQSSLTPEQRARLQALNIVPDAASVITFTKEVDDENAKRMSRCVASRLCGVLESVQQFSSIVETFITSHPEIAALVWGSIKFALLFVSRFSTYFDKLSTVFMNIRNNCPRYMEYQALYTDSERLQAALCNYYATIVRLCQKAIEVGQRQGLQQLTVVLWRPFETEFGSFEAELRRQSEEVKDEISLASKQAADRERLLQIAERKKSSRYRIQGNLHRIEEHKWRLQVDQRESRLRRQHLLEKLSDYDYMFSFKQARKKKHWTTTSWLFDTNDYRNWLASDMSLFWCSGLLGTGKTVLTNSSSIIDDLFRRGASMGAGVIFFFCQFDNAASLTARTILGSLTRQCLDIKNMSKTIEARLMKLLGSGLPDLDELEALFIDQITALKSRFIIIDGVDECTRDEHNVLFTALSKVAGCSSRSFKILIASRPQVGLEIKRFFKSYHHVSMDSPGAHADIARYIKSDLEAKRENGDLKVRNPELIAEIEDVLVSGAQGMFLLVSFQIRDVCNQVNDEDIRNALKRLPRSLPEWYERVLIKIISAGRAEIARKVFRWVAAAKRPLSLDELREAIAIEPCQAFRRLERLVNDTSQAISSCGDLIRIDEEEQVVQFAHPTVKDFFISELNNSQLSKFHFQLSEVDHEAGGVCVTYLNFNDFKRQLIKVSNAPPLTRQVVLQALLSVSLGSRVAGSLSKLGRVRSSSDDNLLRQFQDITGATSAGSLRKLQTDYPFLAYASKYWLLHTSDFTKEDGKVWLLWKPLLSSESFALLPWPPRELERMAPNVIQWIIEHDHAGLLQVAADSDTNPLSSKQRRHLLVQSAAENRLNIASNLVKCSSCLKTDRDIAIVAAAQNGHLSMVGRLLVAKANVNAEPTSDYGRTALQAAAGGGHLEVVERLLAAKAHVNAEPAIWSGRTALQAASGGGHLKVVERLLAANADVNAEPAGSGGRTALQAASEGGHLEVVERLLIAKANVNARPAGDRGRTALQAASGGGHLRVVDRLKSAGAR
ncbi:MAG: hypothetical protein M1840_007217 [Geoglossum simile]|nr:MAG: hypothetical protein M1840_007217 [Geoglossum simile]